MVNPCRYGAYILGVVAFVGIVLGLLVFLINNNTPQRKGLNRKRPLPADGPTAHFFLNFTQSHIIWQRKDMIASRFIEYNQRDNKFIVKEANILSIRLVLHFDVKKMQRDAIGAVCIVLSDGRNKCKADVFQNGSSGILNMKDKIYARPGFSFSVRIQNHHSVIKAIARNFVEITQSFHSGPEINSTYTRVT